MHPWFARTSLLLAHLAGGCCCESPPTPESLPAVFAAPVLDERALIAFIPSFATASCNADARCGTRFAALRLGAVPEDCEAETASTAPYLSWLGHPATFDASQAEACIAFLMSAPCVDLTRAMHEGAFAEVCRDVVHVPDETCSHEPYGAHAGEACTAFTDCGTGLHCNLDAGTCTRGAFTPNERCEPTFGCSDRSLVCVQVEGASRCVAPRSDGTCRPGPSDASGQRGDCSRDHECGDGQCIHLSELGQACGAAHPRGVVTCDEDLICDDGHCVRALLASQSCTSDASCRTGRCAGGVCAFRGPVLCVR